MGTHISEESWFGRIGGAIVGVLFGGLLALISVPVLFWNEGRAVRTAKGLKEGAKVVVDIASDAIDSANEGAFVHTTGETTTDDVLRDDEFALEYNGVRLNRHVEMYQWRENEESRKEKKLGGGTRTITTYTYEQGWHRGRINSDQFDEAQSHQNPADLFTDRSVQAMNVRLGAFRLPDSLIAMMDGSEAISLTQAHLPESLAGAARIQNDGPNGSSRIYVTRRAIGKTSDAAEPDAEPKTQATSADASGRPTEIELPDSPEKEATEPVAEDESAAPTSPTSNSGTPEIGDTRIWFTATPVNTVSLLSQQAGETFQPFETHYDTTIHVLREGTHSADSMIAQEEANNRILTWVLRGVGSLMMFFGLMLVLRPLAVLADVIPFAGAIVGFGSAVVAGLLTIAGSLTVIGIAWVFYRPLLGITLLVIAGGALYLIISRAKTRPQEPEMLTSADLA